MADTLRKQKKQIDALVAERKTWKDSQLRLQRQLEERDRELKAALAKYMEQTERLAHLKETHQNLSNACGRLSEERDNFRKEADDRAIIMRSYRTSLKTEREATEALDKEVARLKQELEKANAEGLVQTRRRLRERSEEVEQLRRELNQTKNKVAELEQTLAHRERSARLGGEGLGVPHHD